MGMDFGISTKGSILITCVRSMPLYSLQTSRKILIHPDVSTSVIRWHDRTFFTYVWTAQRSNILSQRHIRLNELVSRSPIAPSPGGHKGSRASFMPRDFYETISTHSVRHASNTQQNPSQVPSTSLSPTIQRKHNC